MYINLFIYFFISAGFNIPYFITIGITIFYCLFIIAAILVFYHINLDSITIKIKIQKLEQHCVKSFT